MAIPKVTDHATWRQARIALVEREKEVTKSRDALHSALRELPMVRVEKEYLFHSTAGEVSLAALFEGQRQLILQHFMFDPSWDDACSSCTAMADSMSEGIRGHLSRRNTAYAAVSRAPIVKLERVRRRNGWTFRWVSSQDSPFNFDFHVSLDPSAQPAQYNCRDADQLEAAGQGWMVDYRGEQPGISCFLRIDDEIFHAYSTYGRGVESMLPAYQLLDLTPLGRQEPWELPAGRAEVLYRSDQGVLSPERAD